MKLRVWHVQNVPNQPTFHAVESVEAAAELIDKLIKEDLRDVGVSSNGFGLEEYIPKYNDWMEYHDKEGKDIEQIAEDMGYED